MFGKLLGWLKGLFSGSEAETFGVYNPKQRILYRYHDGTKMVVADPMVLYREIMKDHKQLHKDLHMSNEDGPQWEQAQLRLMKRLCEIFKVKRFDEGGRTDGEIISMFLQFMRYCYELQNRGKETNPPTGPMTEGTHEKPPEVKPTATPPATPVTPEATAVPEQQVKPEAVPLPYATPGVPLVLLKGEEPPPNMMPVIRRVGSPAPVTQP